LWREQARHGFFQVEYTPAEGRRTSVEQTSDAAFEAFVGNVEPRLRQAFVAAYGPDLGREATAEALAWAWEHWEKARTMAQPVGYLYRVGQSRTRRWRHRQILFPAVPTNGRMPDVEPGLPAALAQLSEPQRLAVLLIHGHDWSPRSVATLLGVKPTTVATHLERGLTRLRSLLEAPADARQS
jgi:RNA polymerase sigma-70 factor (ECF subfamily)